MAALSMNIAVVQAQAHKLDTLGARAVQENASTGTAGLHRDSYPLASSSSPAARDRWAGLRASLVRRWLFGTQQDQSRSGDSSGFPSLAQRHRTRHLPHRAGMSDQHPSSFRQLHRDDTHSADGCHLLVQSSGQRPGIPPQKQHGTHGVGPAAESDSAAFASGCGNSVAPWKSNPTEWAPWSARLCRLARSKDPSPTNLMPSERNF